MFPAHNRLTFGSCYTQINEQRMQNLQVSPTVDRSAERQIGPNHAFERSPNK